MCLLALQSLRLTLIVPNPSIVLYLTLKWLSSPVKEEIIIITILAALNSLLQKCVCGHFILQNFVFSGMTKKVLIFFIAGFSIT